MRKKVVVLSLTKNEIIIKRPKNKINITHIGMYVSMVIILCVMSVVSFGLVDKGDVAQVFNPVNSLYNDNSDVIFTNGSVGKKEFALPILGSVIENNGYQLDFVVAKSIMVMSPGGGIISECGQSINGVKYIKINHGNDIYSVIENVDIVGVEKGDVVKGGMDIATGKVGQTVSLRFYEGDVQVNGIKVEQSKISWEN